MAAIDLCKAILQNGDNLLIMYPQGEFQSIYKRPINFQKGIIRILQNDEGVVHVKFVVALIDYYAHKKPTLYLYLKDFEKAQHPDALSMEDAFNLFLNESTTLHTK